VVHDTLVCLLAGGEGERLYPLTRDRAKPAVPFGGIYRIVDVTLSNCINSGLRHIYVLTQYKALSLNRHIREGWSILAHEIGEFVTVLPPMKRVSEDWYQGTADAIYQNLYSIGSEPCKYVLILAGDHVYKMNYQLMLKQHVDSGAGVTVGTIEFDRSDASHFGVCEIDSTGRIIGWQEKPADPKPSPHNPHKCHVSMGIYCFNRELLIETLLSDADDPNSQHDFGKNVIPRLIEKGCVYSYNFIDENKKEALYWRDIGTIEAYYEANMDLVSVRPVFNLYDSVWPIRTYQRQYPPPSSSLRRKAAAWESPWTRSSPWVPSSPAGASLVPSFPPTYASTATRKWKAPFFFPTSRSGAIRVSAAPSSTATSISPNTPRSDTTWKKTARNTTSLRPESSSSCPSSACSRNRSRTPSCQRAAISTQPLRAGLAER